MEWKQLMNVTTKDYKYKLKNEERVSRSGFLLKKKPKRAMNTDFGGSEVRSKYILFKENYGHETMENTCVDVSIESN